MTAGGFSGAKRWVRWAEGMRGEYMVRWRRVRSLILSRLLASGRRMREKARKKRRKKKHTKETKVAGVNDSLCVYFASEVVET